MVGSPNHPPKDLLVYQANVGKISPTYNSILNITLIKGINVLYIQEPQTDSGTKTQTNPAFYMLALVDSQDQEDLE